MTTGTLINPSRISKTEDANKSGMNSSNAKRKEYVTHDVSTFLIGVERSNYGLISCQKTYTRFVAF